MINYAGLGWLLLVLGPLLFFQRRTHRDLQASILLLVRRPDISLVLFSLIFLPGVILHELSHFWAALLLGVPTGRFSLLPQATSDGRLRLGYVETGRSDIIRDALIGAAPLVTGGLFVAYAGMRQLEVNRLWERLQGLTSTPWLDVVQGVYRHPDFWLWFYLVFAISSMMFPSASDRRTWLPLAIVLGLLMAAAVLLGAGTWLSENLGPVFNRGLGAVIAVLAISLGVHMLIWLPLAFIRYLLERLTGLSVN